MCSSLIQIYLHQLCICTVKKILRRILADVLIVSNSAREQLAPVQSNPAHFIIGLNQIFIAQGKLFSSPKVTSRNKFFPYTTNKSWHGQNPQSCKMTRIWQIYPRKNIGRLQYIESLKEQIKHFLRRFLCITKSNFIQLEHSFSKSILFSFVQFKCQFFCNLHAFIAHCSSQGLCKDYTFQIMWWNEKAIQLLVILIFLLVEETQAAKVIILIPIIVIISTNNVFTSCSCQGGAKSVMNRRKNQQGRSFDGNRNRKNQDGELL